MFHILNIIYSENSGHLYFLHADGDPESHFPGKSDAFMSVR